MAKTDTRVSATRDLIGFIIDVLSALWQALRKDIVFFGPIGFIVSWIMVVEHVAGATPDTKRWSTELVGDFLSPHAFLLTFLVTIGVVGAMRAIPLRFTQRRCKEFGQHMEERLHALVASAIAFTIGVVAFILWRVLMNVSTDGLVFVVLLVRFDAMLVLGLVCAGTLCRGIDLFGWRAISVKSPRRFESVGGRVSH